jgi:glycosyltransferase involved in cell wall biosynthesis
MSAAVTAAASPAAAAPAGLRTPTVSVGMPVYNDSKYVRTALDALRAQTLTDFEVIISDNASTDGTRDICEEYVRLDKRFRYIRQPTNIGAPRNWNAVVHEARGEFFKWSSGNDYCAPEMLQRCVDALRADPTAVLCYGRTQIIDEADRQLDVYRGDISIVDDRPSERFARSRNISMNNAQQGVVRRAVLMQTSLDRLYPHGDLALMSELALRGSFLLLPEVLLFRRSGTNSITARRSRAEIQRIFNPQARSEMKLVLGRLHADHFASVARAPIPLTEKLRAWAHSLRRVVWDRAELLNELRLFVPLGRAHRAVESL